MNADDKFEKDLLESSSPKKPKESEGVDKTVDDLLKSTLSGLGLGIESEKKKQMLSGEAAAPKTEPPKPVAPPWKEPPPARPEAFDVKPQEKAPKVDSSSWLKEPPAKKPEPSIFKPEPPAKKIEPKTIKGKEEFPEFQKKGDVFPGSYTEPEKKKSKPIVPIVGGAAVVVVAAVAFLVLGGKKETTQDTRGAVTTVKRDLGTLPDAGTVTTDSPEVSESGSLTAAATEPPVKEKPQSAAEKPVADRPAPAPEKRSAAETAAAAEPAGAPLVPVDQGAVRVQEIKPTRTQPTAAESAAAAGTAAAPARPKTILGQLIPIEEADTVPVLVRRIEPEYPPLAFRMKSEGSVTVNVLIDETGAVVRTEVLKASGSPYGFEKASRDAVIKWRYRPAVKDGTYVKVWMPVVVTFTIQR